MVKAREEVREFLKKYGMYYGDIDLDKNCEVFAGEMENGLADNQSSLKMLPTYITMDREIPVNEPIIVIDAGGTNFRVAVAYFDKNKKPIIEDFSQYTMPGTRGEISKEAFFDAIVDYISPVLDKSDTIGFCFSYPTDALPNRDGILLQLSKEVRVKDLVGEAIGENLRRVIGERGFQGDKKVVMLNDTVATLLGGKASYPDRIFDSYLGFILGTGTNTCYIEENSKIKKIEGKSDPAGSMIINTESGGYGKIVQGELDREFDLQTVDPGVYSFEKMVSGRYQSGLMKTIFKRAAQDGLLSKYFLDKFNEIKEITLPEINEFLDYPYSDNKLSSCCLEDSSDRTVLYFIIDAVLERAARIITINLAGIMIKIQKGENPCRPVCITAEGSTFYKLKHFRSKLDYYIKSYLNEQRGLYCEFIKAENATLIGTMIAGLLNK